MNIRKWLMIISCFFLLTGCWDKIELEEEGFVIALGLDKGPTPNSINVTYQIANPQVGSSTLSQSQTEPPSDIVSISVPSVATGKDTANTIAPREINLTHLKTIIISEELAKSDNFESIFSSAIRDPQLRREANIIVTKETALDFIKNNKPKMETRPHKYYDFMNRRWRETGMVPFATINRYFHRLETTNTILLTIYATTEKEESQQEGKGGEAQYYAGQVPQLSGDPTQVIGSAVLKGGKMIGKLTGEETRFSLVLRKKSLANSWSADLKDPIDPNFTISLRVIKEANTKVKFDVSHPIPKVYVTVPFQIELTSIPSGINYVTNKKNLNILDKALKEDFEKKSMALVKKTQKEYHDEPFLWSIDAKKAFLTDKAYQNYHWKEKYPDAEVHIKYDVKIEHFGKQLEPAT